METCLGWMLNRRVTTDYRNNNAVKNFFKTAAAQIDTQHLT